MDDCRIRGGVIIIHVTSRCPFELEITSEDAILPDLETLFQCQPGHVLHIGKLRNPYNRESEGKRQLLKRVRRCLSVCLINCYWSSPSQSFLAPSPSGPMTIFFCPTALGVLQFTPVNLDGKELVTSSVGTTACLRAG
jgi:hypothetical protein